MTEANERKKTVFYVCACKVCDAVMCFYTCTRTGTHNIERTLAQNAMLPCGA